MTDLEIYNLQGNDKLSTLHFDNEEDWLEIRTKGIGGSDIGAIMGLNKYSSPLLVYKQKVEGFKVDLSNNANVKKGKDLEDFILTHFVNPLVSSKGYVVGKPDFMIVNSDMPYFRANVDGIAYKPGTTFDKNIIIEIKWVSEYAEVNWNGPEFNGIPASYYAQVQLYMAVTGAKSALVCALFDKDWEFHYYKIPRDDTFILGMKAKAKKFYEFNMAMKMPPMASTDIDKDEVVKIIKHAPIPTNPSAEMTKYVEEYLAISKQIKELEREKSAKNDLILEGYKNGLCPDNPEHNVKLTVTTSHRFNTTKFKEADPATYEQYCEDSESSRFTIK